MKKIVKNIIKIAMYIALLLGTATPAFANQDKAQESMPAGFSYTIVKPENQRSDTGYYDIRVKPGQKQVLELDITNTSKEKEVEVSIAISGAKTNSNGVIEYSPSTIENDPSLKYPLESIVKGPKTIKIAPSAKERVALEVEMPEVQYDGVIAGGIELKVVPDKNEKTEPGIKNRYAFLIGILLNENDNPVAPELSFNTIHAGLSNYSNAIFVNFSNINATFAKGLTTEVEIMKKGSKEVLYDTKKNEMKMAPNSQIEFPVSLNGDRVEAGDYTGHVIATIGDKKWEWTEDFKITKEEADKYNGQDVNLTQERGIDWKIIAVIVVSVLVVIGIIFVIVRKINSKKQKKKKKKANKNRTKNNKK